MPTLLRRTGILYFIARSYQQDTCLVEASCSMSILSADGKAPIQLAVGRGFCSVAEHLLLKGAPLPQNILLDVLVVQANRSMRTMPATVTFLIEKKADVHARAPNGDMPLHAVLEPQRRVQPYQTHFLLEVVKLLIRTGADVHVCDALGHTYRPSIAWAARYEYAKIYWCLSCGIRKR